jgi:hypothetical protein
MTHPPQPAVKQQSLRPPDISNDCDLAEASLRYRLPQPAFKQQSLRPANVSNDCNLAEASLRYRLPQPAFKQVAVVTACECLERLRPG